jgi:sugar transferase (PEP-CTERM/EpsH1 system associated)
MKLFVLLSRVPYPLEKGDKLRAYHQLKELAKSHEVFLCCLSDRSPDPIALEHLEQFISHVKVVRLSRWKQALQLISGLFVDLPFQVLYFKQRKAMHEVEALVHAFQPDHIVCQLVRTSEYLKNIFQYPKSIDYQDALSAGYKRRMSTVPIWQRPLFMEESARLKKYEQLVFEYFDFHWIISDQDRQLINHPQRNQILVVPNGVDTAYFTPVATTKKFDLVFAGNMGYAPNVECAKRIAMQILPLIQRSRPQTTLLIAGAEPTGEVKSLAFASDTITVSGWMDDIRNAYRDSRMLIAPMTIGSGMQNKILEAMSCELPCITSSLVMGGLGVQGESPIAVCESDEEFAQTAIELLDQKEHSADLGIESRHFAIRHFSWSSQLNEWIKKIAQ